MRFDRNRYKKRWDLEEMNLLNVQKNKKCGFTLAELLIVVAIVGILVAISIPIFSVQLHKARVAADWANLRAYYSEIQADYIATGKYNPAVPVTGDRDFPTEITFLDGQKVKLKEGKILIREPGNGYGYQIAYYCNEYLKFPKISDWETHYKKCSLFLGGDAL